MKVIDGGFGQQEEEDTRTPLQILTDHLENTGLSDVEGTFLFLMDTGTSMAMLSNVNESCEALMILEKSKTAIMMAEFAGESGQDPASS